MSVSHKHFSIAATAIALVSCKTTPQQPPMTAAECQAASRCVAEGMLEMSTDGHAYIGILRMADGACINVSLPERESEKLFGKKPVQRMVAGGVFPFPFSDEEMFSWKVNGRKIGFGTCGAHYIFVD